MSHLHRGHALEVRLAGGDVLLVHLLGQVQHVGRKQRLAVLLKVLLQRRGGVGERGEGEKISAGALYVSKYLARRQYIDRASAISHQQRLADHLERAHSRAKVLCCSRNTFHKFHKLTAVCPQYVQPVTSSNRKHWTGLA